MATPEGGMNIWSIFRSRAPEVGEQREVPKILKCEGNPGKPLVAIALKDPGGTNFLLPVLSILKKRGFPMVLHTTGHTKDKVQLPDYFEPASSVEGIEPGIVIRTYADTKHGASRALPSDLEKKWRSATFVDIEDYPAGPGRTIQREGGRAPDWLCVINDSAKETRVKHRRSGVDPRPENIKVTGSPVFDQYAGVNHESRKREAREKLGVTNEFVVLFSGQNPPATPIALEQTVRALNALRTDKKLILVFSRHPRDKSDESLAKYTKALGSFRKDGRVILQSDSGLSTEEAGYAANLLVSTHSTEALKSMHKGVATLHIGLHKKIRDTKDYQEFDQPPFPVQAGASFWIENGDDTKRAKRVLSEAINNDAVRQRIVERGREAIKINKEDPDGKSA
ncbi:MAG: hypothetical protein Q7R74_00360, partial [bacterium]|nr:hypothetical protein [bacterium]